MKTLRNKIVLTAVIAVLCNYVYSQEEAWEPQKHITGYISTQGEYIDGLQIFERNYGFTLNEAGILCTYQPSQKLTFKTTFVYRPGLFFDQMLNDAYAEWKFNDHFKIKTGRFLTPLSPVNLSQYAPMNTAASLPMLVTHHNMYPMHTDGISFNGTIGETLKFNYNAFAGGYFDSGYLPFDPIGYAGKEILYTEAMEIGGKVDFETKQLDMDLFGAIGGHVGANINDVFNVGLNIFYGGTKKYVNPFDSASVEEAENTDIGKGTKHAFGIDAKLKISKFQLSGEHWFGKLAAVNEPSQDISGGFYELNGTFGNFTPYLQYERHLMYDLHYSRYVAGLNFKPNFETTFKLEYFHFAFDGNEELGKYGMNGILASIIYSF